MWYIYTIEYYSAIKKTKTTRFAATWIELEILKLSEVSQTEKDKYHMISLICGVLMNLPPKQKYSPRCRKQTYGYQGGEKSEGRRYTGKLELIYTHSCI